MYRNRACPYVRVFLWKMVLEASSDLARQSIVQGCRCGMYPSNRRLLLDCWLACLATMRKIPVLVLQHQPVLQQYLRGQKLQQE